MKYLVAKAQTMLATRDKGATAVEYGLMVALVAVVIIAAVTLLGTEFRACPPRGSPTRSSKRTRSGLGTAGQPAVPSRALWTSTIRRNHTWSRP